MIEHFEKNPEIFLKEDFPMIFGILFFAAACGIITKLLLEE